MNVQTISLAFLATVAVGSVAYVFIYPMLSGEKQAESRRASVAKPEPAKRQNEKNLRSRREQVESSLKDLEARRDKQSKVPLSSRLTQAGLSWTVQKFYMFSAVLAAMFFAGGLFAGGGLLGAAGLAFAAGFGLPRWGLSFLKKRREAAFLKALPDAVDVIVRGIKAGLPLLECMRIVANESAEPVKSEFRSMVETQTVGIPLGDAVTKLYEHLPLAECNFFAIVIGIQQKTGGNLSEALGNLSHVLRDRKKMKAKIQAMSMEAKASAAIIGALPVVVMILVYLTSPDYIELLWTHPMGRMMLVACAVWMSMGTLVMKKMINFDF
jgi:tight adherence protein B